jgi:hypothetical protein
MFARLAAAKTENMDSIGERRVARNGGGVWRHQAAKAAYRYRKESRTKTSSGMKEKVIAGKHRGGGRLRRRQYQIVNNTMVRASDEVGSIKRSWRVVA